MTGLAYERDLSQCLEVIYSDFNKWKSDEISVWDLNDRIHEFHDDIGRELYKIYNIYDLHMIVAFAIKRGVLDIRDVNQECRPEVHRIVDLLGQDEEGEG
ncbi:hypothetical protein [Candidatus Thiodiazotropha sp. CDECU1]|uniref:hypothetical protein n=1 Tax=Candidatus Thiodiazotropha sp. CDECU1 TaxID=3065865 RepID=UPI00292FBFC4|nr:hypothetical protein [Candidatus Thiodiazotropha sp. CDECU1]